MGSFPGKNKSPSGEEGGRRRREGEEEGAGGRTTWFNLGGGLQEDLGNEMGKAAPARSPPGSSKVHTVCDHLLQPVGKEVGEGKEVGQGGGGWKIPSHQGDEVTPKTKGY